MRAFIYKPVDLFDWNLVRPCGKNDRLVFNDHRSVHNIDMITCILSGNAL